MFDRKEKIIGPYEKPSTPKTVATLIFIIICIAAGLNTNNVSAAAPKTTSNCSSGITVIPVKVEGAIQYRDEMGAYIVQPNDGCDAPKQLCITITWENSWGKSAGGLSCTVIDSK